AMDAEATPAWSARAKGISHQANGFDLRSRSGRRGIRGSRLRGREITFAPRVIQALRARRVAGPYFQALALLLHKPFGREFIPIKGVTMRIISSKGLIALATCVLAACSLDDVTSGSDG